jgi:hypothetical protein
MRCTFKQFEAIADAHRKEIARHGFSSVRQLFYDAGPLRRLWRAATRKQWQGWRSYWEGLDIEGQRVFLKVSFGFDWLQPDQEMIEAENEMRICAHFHEHLRGLRRVRIPDIRGRWMTADAYYAAFTWMDHRKIDLLEALEDPILTEALSGLLRRLYAIPPPDGWGAAREPHNFACSRYDEASHRFAAPVDVDFIKNIGVDSVSGALFFFDFEKVQWARPGLQETLLLQYLQSRLSALGKQADRRKAGLLIGHVPQAERAAAIEQGWRILEKHGSAWGLPWPSEALRREAAALIVKA